MVMQRRLSAKLLVVREGMTTWQKGQPQRVRMPPTDGRPMSALAGSGNDSD